MFSSAGMFSQFIEDREGHADLIKALASYITLYISKKQLTEEKQCPSIFGDQLTQMAEKIAHKIFANAASIGALS